MTNAPSTPPDPTILPQQPLTVAGKRLTRITGKIPIDILATAAKPNKEPEVSTLETAIRYHEEGKWDEAISAYQKAFHEAPFNAEIQQAIATIYLYKNEFDLCIEAAQKALQIEPEYVNALSCIASASLELKSYEQAKEVCTQILKLEPKNTEALFKRGLVEFYESSFSEAHADLEKAVELSPLYPSLALSYLAMSEAWDGFLLQAEKTAHRAEAISPDAELLWHTWHTISAIAYTERNAEIATRSAKKVLELKPTHCRGHIDLGKAHEISNQPDQALQHYTQATQLSPEIPTTWEHLGMFFYKNNRFEEAHAAFAKLIALEPSNGFIHCCIGDCLEKLKQPENALHAYYRAVKADPTLCKGWNNIGLILQEKNDHLGAIEAFKRATEVDPQYATAWYNLAITLQKNGDTYQAEEAMNKYEEINPSYRL